jgi:hypothetical protein
MIVLAFLVAAAGAAAAPPPSILVMPLKPAQASDAPLVELLSASLAGGVKKSHDKGKVVGADEVRSMLDAKAQQALLGCDDERCAGDVGKAVAVDWVVSGTAGTLGTQVLCFASLLDLKDGAVLARASAAFDKGGKLDEQMAALAKRLVDPDAQRAGDDLMKEQFAALIIEETGTSNDHLSTCAADAVLAGGGRLVKPDVAKRARERMGADGVTSKNALDVLSEADVLSLLYGKAVYADSTKPGDSVNRRASLTLQLVAVGTGDIVLSLTAAGNGRGYSVDAADQAAAAAACEELKTSLPAALSAHVARGVRATVEVAKATTPAAALLALTEVQKVPFVRSARIMSTTAKGSSLDVTLKGKDGIALGLALAENDALGPVASTNETAVKIALPPPPAPKKKGGAK